MSKRTIKKLDLIVATVFVISLCGLWVLATYLIFPPVPQRQVAQNDVTVNEQVASLLDGSISFSEKEQTTMVTKMNTVNDLSWIFWLVGAVVVVLIIWNIVKSGYGAILIFGMLGLALVGFIFWILLFRGGDVSTPEAREENIQVIGVVHPVGNDPAVDQAYAEINKTNAGTNVVNAAGVSIYTVLIWITVIIFFGIGVFLWYVVHK